MASNSRPVPKNFLCLGQSSKYKKLATRPSGAGKDPSASASVRVVIPFEAINSSGLFARSSASVNRHMFLRRAVLGYAKARKTVPNQREADFDEVFDESFHTTGYSRPLELACDGHERCDMVEQLLASSSASDKLAKLWYYLAIGPLEYVSKGTVDEYCEDSLGTALHIHLAQVYRLGLVEEMTWLICHASQHAWQVNFMMEAAMFGSFLDDGALRGKLDRLD